ncbi:MAG: hypothetical protein J1E98_15380 [Lachnospiraceae bacterium]|nr:hypothetical protein [Lachnospiraceae bacterium]
MGKQINYYMGYNDFLSVAQAALNSGCIIYRHSLENGKWKLFGGTTLDTVKDNCCRYYFHIPSIGNFDIEQKSDNQYVSNKSLLNVIEAGFSIPTPKGKNYLIVSNRLYVITGQYADDDNWVSRSELLTKTYNKLVRIVKKTAPYTEVEYFVVNPMYEGKKFKSKKYISSDYYDLVQNKDYILG